MAESWYCSDHHLWHDNIIQYAKRPFANCEEMHEALLDYHNQTVRPQDHVSFLGDVTLKRGGSIDRKMFTDEIKKYNGHKRLYLGNHDHFPISTYLEVFEKIYATWRTEDGLLLSHIPIHPQSLGSAIANVHGHIHDHLEYQPHMVVTREGEVLVKPYINVCVEAIDYRPIHRDEIMARIALIIGAEEYDDNFYSIGNP